MSCVSVRALGTGLAVAVSVLAGFTPAGAQAGGPLPAGDALRALEAAAERYRNVRALCADFDQVMEVRLLGRTIESAGRVCQRRPNLLSMRFSDPDGDLVVSDGDRLLGLLPQPEPGPSCTLFDGCRAWQLRLLPRVP